MALCPRVALENAAQHRGASVGAASARLFTEKCAKKASAVAAVGLAWPRAVEDALPLHPLPPLCSLALHTRKYVKLLTNFNSS